MWNRRFWVVKGSPYSDFIRRICLGELTLKCCLYIFHKDTWWEDCSNTLPSHRKMGIKENCPVGFRLAGFLLASSVCTQFAVWLSKTHDIKYLFPLLGCLRNQMLPLWLTPPRLNQTITVALSLLPAPHRALLFHLLCLNWSRQKQRGICVSLLEKHLPWSEHFG